VLIDDHGQDGASNLPPLTAHAASHGDTAPRTGHRDATETAAPTIATTASANGDPDAAGTTGSGPVSTSSTVNTTRTASDRPAKRRSQPRTVSTGRRSRAAITANGVPAALAANAAPITSARSARRHSATTGNNTCEMPHPEHIARRGRTATSAAPRPRRTRVVAHPHGDNRAPHSGQERSPTAKRRSTEAASTSTVSTAPPSATRPSRPLGQEHSGRAAPCSDIGKVPPPTITRNPPEIQPDSSAFTMPAHTEFVGILSDAQQAGMPSWTSALPAARIASSFCAAAAMVVSIAATSPSQPCSVASRSRSTRLAWIFSNRGI
jgi:hypothetical protein